LRTKFLILRTQFLVLRTQFLILRTQFLVLRTQFLILRTQFLVLRTQFLVLRTQFFVLRNGPGNQKFGPDVLFIDTARPGPASFSLPLHILLLRDLGKTAVAAFGERRREVKRPETTAVTDRCCHLKPGFAEVAKSIRAWTPSTSADGVSARAWTVSPRADGVSPCALGPSQRGGGGVSGGKTGLSPPSSGLTGLKNRVPMHPSKNDKT
jgi:hypothetical protein